ncbi:general odorant-binding protein 28a [Manduca sexta]|uniref:general odorant-binding protein 28a n=1 Tax=Manduca sexta TaxID=7130 RepID=UPI00188DD421|nr:general odorant-binding protein 28a [Manduca sexta]
MSVISFFVLCFGVFAVSVGAVSENERNQISQSILPHIVKCSQEYGVSEGQIKDAKESVNPLGLNPCFLGCVLKSAGIIDKNGLFDVEATKEKSKKYISSEKDVTNFDKIIKDCTEVNQKNVSDGNKGCDRAKELVTCFLAKRGDFSVFTF